MLRRAKKLCFFFRIQKGIWSSLVYGARLENEYFTKVVSSNLTVPVYITINTYNLIFQYLCIFNFLLKVIFFTLPNHTLVSLFFSSTLHSLSAKPSFPFFEETKGELRSHPSFAPQDLPLVTQSVHKVYKKCTKSVGRSCSLSQREGVLVFSFCSQRGEKDSSSPLHFLRS